MTNVAERGRTGLRIPESLTLSRSRHCNVTVPFGELDVLVPACSGDAL